MSATSDDDAPPERGVIIDREAEERLVLRPGVGTLLRVDMQFEAPFDEAGQGRRDPPAGLLAADADVTVIRVPHEPVAAMPKRAISSSNSESNRNIPNLPGVFGAGAIGGEPPHASDVQQSGFAPALR